MTWLQMVRTEQEAFKDRYLLDAKSCMETVGLPSAFERLL